MPAGGVKDKDTAGNVEVVEGEVSLVLLVNGDSACLLASLGVKVDERAFSSEIVKDAIE